MNCTVRALFLPSVLALSIATSTTVSAQGFRVTWTGERLTIVAAQAPLAQVLAEVARQTQIQIVDLEKVTGAVSADIRGALLLDALRTLLSRHDYMIRYSETSEASSRVRLWTHAPKTLAELARAQTISTPPASLPEVVAVPDELPPPVVPDPVVDEVARLSKEGEFDARATESSLLGLARSPNHEVRMRALQSLALQSTSAGMQAIQGALSDENPFVRAVAMDLLVSQSPGPESTSRLGTLVQHADPAVRGAAAMALGQESGPEADLLLNRALDDEDRSVRSFAAQSLKQKHSGEKPKR